MKEYQNYIFDLYGTLVDIKTDEESFSFWKKILSYIAKHGKCPVADAEVLKEKYSDLIRKEEIKLNGSNREIDLRYVLCELLTGNRNEYRSDTVQDFADFFRNTSVVYLKLYENTLPTLKQLKERGKKTLLLSNAQSCFTLHELEQLGLKEYFEGIYISSDYGVKKPNPLFLKTLMEKEQISAQETVMIGNEIQSDIACALGYGMESVFLNTGNLTEHKREQLLEKAKSECLRNIRQDGSAVLSYQPFVIESGNIAELLTY